MVIQGDISPILFYFQFGSGRRCAKDPPTMPPSSFFIHLAFGLLPASLENVYVEAWWRQPALMGEWEGISGKLMGLTGVLKGY